MRAGAVATALFVGVWALVSSLDLSRAVAQAETGGDAVLERWLARAERLHERGRDRPAVVVLRRAMERAPADPRPLVSLVDIALPSESDHEDAIEPSPGTRALAAEVAERFERVIVDGDPTDPEHRAMSARVRSSGPWAIALTGDHRTAIDGAALAAGRMDRVAAEILAKLSALAIRRHDLVAADEALVAATRADPTDVDLLADLAAVRLARGNPDDSVRLLLDAARRRPDSLAIERDLAGSLLAAGRVSEGLAAFAAIAGEHPDDARAQLDLARAALEANRPERAARAARAAAALTTRRDPEPSLVLGSASIASGDHDGAREAFREALRRDPGNVLATRGLASLAEGTR